MKKLILLDHPQDSDIKFKINYFPDGQQSITLDQETIPLLYKKGEFVIVKTITSFKDLELILSCVSALNKHTNEYSLYSPYITGARSDRKFEMGGDMYLDDVILPILKSCNFKNIYALDFHCDRDVITSIKNDAYFDFDKHKNNNTVFVFPDKSAFKRYEHILNSDIMLLNSTIVKHNYIYCDKVRLDDGTIKQKFISSEYSSDINEYIVIDDLFDGGRSYVGLIERLKYVHPNAKFQIYTTHMIGSNVENLDKLLEYNVTINTTCSYMPFIDKYFNIRSLKSYKYTNINIKDVLFDKEFIKSII